MYVLTCSLKNIAYKSQFTMEINNDITFTQLKSNNQTITLNNSWRIGRINPIPQPLSERSISHRVLPKMKILNPIYKLTPHTPISPRLSTRKITRIMTIITSPNHCVALIDNRYKYAQWATPLICSAKKMNMILWQVKSIMNGIKL
jgi:hypothetical protein